METTRTLSKSSSPKTVLPLFLLVVLVMAIFGLGMLRRPLTPQMAEVYIPPYNMAVSSLGEVKVTLPTDGAGLPDCNDIIPGCKWDSELRRTVTGEDTVIETNLTVDGKVVGQAQVMEVETLEYQELEVLHHMGHEKAWISHIRIARAYRGVGLGRTLWQASDSMIKVLVGSGNAIHIFVDQAGWGPSLMRSVPTVDIILEDLDFWAYIIR